ncbi:MAG: DUF192 domain-containing protein [Betaproteobacteria bacterium]|jgi:uncharacterized membrane protein (UPF0127 family)|nr:DUF192 domain-containing protein [Betaproteobacteria bacterium]
MKSLALFLLTLPLALAVPPAVAQPGKPNTGLPVVKLTIAGHALAAEVATTDAQVRTGLMFRFSLAPDSGMLFVYSTPQPMAFWMRNTYVPLSIAFIAADGRIINIEDMAPLDERLKFSTAPALYALEMRKGWFAQKGIRAGAKVEGLPPASRE